MEKQQNNIEIKKPVKPTSREVNSTVELLRALQLGLKLEDLAMLDGGQLVDLIIEHNNDSYEYLPVATTEDYDELFGG